jgi:hypothetical protein
MTETTMRDDDATFPARHHQQSLDTSLNSLEET